MNILLHYVGEKYMERNSLSSQGYKLESQIRDAFGRVVYTQTCHDKIIHRLIKRDKNIRLWQIILSAITTSGFIASIFSDNVWASIIGAIISLTLLMLNMYIKNNNLLNQIKAHQNASSLLWKIREEYVSLLTDFDILDSHEIMMKRDDLQNRTFEIYNQSPRTDPKSYKEAQKALKTEEEQTFSDLEIDVMLPNSIRRKNRNIE